MEWHGKRHKKELYTKIMDDSLKANKYFMHKESEQVYVFQKDQKI